MLSSAIDIKATAMQLKAARYWIAKEWPVNVSAMDDEHVTWFIMANYPGGWSTFAKFVKAPVSLVKPESGTWVVKFRSLNREHGLNYGKIVWRMRNFAHQADMLADLLERSAQFELMACYTI